jgi:hypothetical protein
MKCRFLLLPVLLLASYSLVFAQGEAPPRALQNRDILRLHKAGMKPGQIIAKIVTSPCNFDIFPPVLRELKMKGLPDTVIRAMVMVPYGPAASPAAAAPSAEPAPQKTKVLIPAGTVVQLEITSPVSSEYIHEGGQINLRVSRRVLVDGVLVIHRGALARARVIKSKPARGWGRGGRLDWVLEDVVAVDGTVVPIKLSDHVSGSNRSAAVVAAAIVTGAIVFPYTPPVGLIWALKKGGEAVLDENTRSSAIVSGNTEVAGTLPEKKKVIYHSVGKMKATNSANSPGLPPMSNSFRPSGMGRH